MPVLFTAVEIPELIQTSILDLCPENIGVKNFRNFHITLHYIGVVNDVDAKLIQGNLMKIQAKSYSQIIKGAGSFNQARTSHVLWAGVNKSEELLKLHQTIGQYLQEVGVKLENRQYCPHITVARIKNNNDDQVESFIDKYSQFNTEFTVRGFSLFSSERTKSGSIYTKLHSYQF